MSVTNLATRTAAAPEHAKKQSHDIEVWRREDSGHAGDTPGMAQKFADIADRPVETSAIGPAYDVSISREGNPANAQTPPATPADKRRLLIHKLGTETAKTLGWNPAHYTHPELSALGEQLIVDHALHGDEASGARMLVAIAKAAGALEADAAAQGDHDKMAGQIGEFLQHQLKDELAVSHAAAQLAQLQAPSKLAMAREFLQKVGLDPDREMRPVVAQTLEFLSVTLPRGKAGNYYFNHDPLAGHQIRDMSDRELSDAEIAALQARLPASLDQEFGQRFDAYTRDAAELSTSLMDSWLSWIAKKQGMDLSEARIEVSTAKLKTYYREVAVLRGSAFMYDGPLREEFEAIGYLATIHTAGGEYRYFLSTRDGSARPLPPGISFEDWTHQNRHTVFDVAQEDKQANHRHAQRPLHSYVTLQGLGSGRRAELPQWLTPALRDHFDERRETARGQTEMAQGIDFLLDFVPFRRMIVAIQQDDIVTALSAGTLDVMFFLVPLLPTIRRATLAAARLTVAPMARLIGEEFATRGMARIRAALAELPQLRASIKDALASMNASSMAADGVRPLDAESMATALRARHPALADALEQSAGLERGPDIHDRWWRVPATHTATADDAAIETLHNIHATDWDGNTLALLPYGNDSGRAYTQVDLATQQRVGAVLLADSEGFLYQSLPASTLERYRVRSSTVLRALAAQRPAAEGTLTVGGKTYARIMDDYVEIMAEHGSTADRPAWRVIAPSDAKRDIVTHRLSYDKERGLWRQADMPELKGGSGRRPASPNRPRGVDASGVEVSPAGGLRGIATGGDVFHEILLSRISGNPAPQEIEAVRDLLTRLDKHPRGKAILRAMQANHELRREVPEIVLINRADVARPRPLLEVPAPGTTWHLDLNALNAESLDSAASEIAAVYNNMTGILQGEDPFAAALARGEPRLDKKLETSWRQWVRDESGRTPRTGPLPWGQENLAVERHEALIQDLRSQLKQAHCYGGLDRATFLEVLGNRFEGEMPGLRVDLRGDVLLSETGVLVGADNRIITTIPPLPDYIHQLDVSNRAIRDWSNLPPNLKVLVASNTGGGEVLKNLPAGLIELDVSKNSLDELPLDLPANLKRLNLDDNKLSTLRRLPDTLEDLCIRGNGLEHLPEELPSRLKFMWAPQNRLSGLPARLPAGLELLDLSGNSLRELPDMSGLQLKGLDLRWNRSLTALPRLPETLDTLYATECSLSELPDVLPGNLEELHLGHNRLTRLPDLPRRLRVLALNNNQLERLPANITELDFCEIYLQDNPIAPGDIPHTPPGRPGPRIHFSMARVEPNAFVPSRTIAGAVRNWLDDQTAATTIARWEQIGRTLEGAAADAPRTAPFRTFLDRLRETASYKNAEFRASIQEWLVELSKPERESLLETTLHMCVDALEQCDDRVSLKLNHLQKLRVHDDIRLGYYSDRPAQALDKMRQLFRLRKLENIAYRKMASMHLIDDVEVYLAYTVKLREPLGLSTVVPEMRFFGLAGLTEVDLDIALREVREAERVEFYKDLVNDDTWNALIKQKTGERYDKAMEKLSELAEEPLQERISAVKRELSSDAGVAQTDIAASVWRDMRYEVLEPLTREYLESAGLPIP